MYPQKPHQRGHVNCVHANCLLARSLPFPDSPVLSASFAAATTAPGLWTVSTLSELRGERGRDGGGERGRDGGVERGRDGGGERGRDEDGEKERDGGVERRGERAWSHRWRGG